MSSHILGEVARLAQRIGIIHAGRLLQEMEIEQLELERRRRLIVRTRDNTAARAALAAAGHTSEPLPDGSLVLTTGEAVSHPDDIATRLVQAGAPPTQLWTDEEDLEHYFLRRVGSDGEKQNG